MKHIHRQVICAWISVIFLLGAYQVFAKGASQGASQGSTQGAVMPVPVKGTLRLSTTTSTQDSGLLGFLLPVFTAETGWNVDVISVGTGAALQMGKDGDADVLLVHAKAQEEQFVAEGHGLKRFDVMYNDFIVVGPSSPIAHNDNVNQTFKSIADQNLPFVSRGDRSGTHTMELNLWKAAGVADPEKLAKYNSAGQGMGATLQMSNELRAYTLSDRATWLKQQQNGLVIVCEKGTALLNFYGVIAVNPSKNSKINAQAAQDFISWMLSPRGQGLIGQYGVAEFGGALFTPNAGANG